MPSKYFREVKRVGHHQPKEPTRPVVQEVLKGGVTVSVTSAVAPSFTQADPVVTQESPDFYVRSRNLWNYWCMVASSNANAGQIASVPATPEVSTTQTGTLFMLQGHRSKKVIQRPVVQDVLKGGATVSVTSAVTPRPA